MHYSVSKVMLLLPLVVFTLSIVSCEKSRQRTLYGKIIHADTKEPVNNRKYELAVTSYASGINETEEVREYQFATDSNGDFQLIFEAISKETLMIGYPGGSIYWSKSIGRKDISINTGTIEDSK